MINYLPRLVGIGSVKLIRSFHQTCANRIWSSYDGPGKTTVTILNTKQHEGLLITDVSCGGFKFNNGYWALGPTIVFPRTALSWNIGSTDEIDENSLVLFKIIQPRIDIMVVGLDKQYAPNTPFIKRIKEFAHQMNIKTEITTSQHASTTFNFLCGDRRYVVGLFLPPKYEMFDVEKGFDKIDMKRKIDQIEAENKIF